MEKLQEIAVSLAVDYLLPPLKKASQLSSQLKGSKIRYMPSTLTLNLLCGLIISIGMGQGKGFDVDLIKLISDAVSIPVIASGGAGAPQHFSEGNDFDLLTIKPFVFKKYHKQIWDHLVPIQSVKEHLLKEGIEV
uniref:Uncharacterized protein n=1 Tax=Glycine max TaxID=3847 RepID=A0A0R0IVJ3_SOYBN